MNIGNAVKKINEAMKIVAVMKKYIKEPKVETPAAKEGLDKMTKLKENADSEEKDEEDEEG